MNQVDEVIREMAKQGRRGESRAAIRSLSAVLMIIVWEIFRAFVFPVIAERQINSAHIERAQLRDELSAFKADFEKQIKLRGEIIESLNCQPEGKRQALYELNQDRLNPS